MPYIDQESRRRLNVGLDDAETLGELTYLLTQRCLDYFETTGKRYADIASVVGALECCKLEWYRRMAGPYEDRKIVENGDVYPKD